MDASKEDKGGEEKSKAEEASQKHRGGVGVSKGKSCAGYLYYSSTLKAHGTNPRCIGIPRTLHQVPNYIVGQSEAEASKEGRTLSDFYYGCAGYSSYINKDRSLDKQASKTELPFCVGLELLVDRRVVSSETAPTAAHARNREDGRELPQTRSNKPAHPTDEFLSRFTRNATLVASGVARNVRRVGNYIKESLDDVLYSFRRRPK